MYASLGAMGIAIIRMILNFLRFLYKKFRLKITEKNMKNKNLMLKQEKGKSSYKFIIIYVDLS